MSFNIWRGMFSANAVFLFCTVWMSLPSLADEDLPLGAYFVQEYRLYVTVLESNRDQDSNTLNYMAWV